MQHYAWINVQMKQAGRDSVDTQVEELDQVISGNEAQCPGCHRCKSTVSGYCKPCFLMKPSAACTTSATETLETASEVHFKTANDWYKTRSFPSAQLR
jgi:Zn-dependent alcohol dehydrogenase